MRGSDGRERGSEAVDAGREVLDRPDLGGKRLSSSDSSIPHYARGGGGRCIYPLLNPLRRREPRRGRPPAIAAPCTRLFRACDSPSEADVDGWLRAAAIAAATSLRMRSRRDASNTGDWAVASVSEECRVPAETEGSWLSPSAISEREREKE